MTTDDPLWIFAALAATGLVVASWRVWWKLLVLLAAALVFWKVESEMDTTQESEE